MKETLRNPDNEFMNTRMPTRITCIAGLIAVAAGVAPVAASAKAPVRAHAAAAQCANANLQVTSADRVAVEAAEVCLINQQRTEHGLPMLKVSTKLDRSAQGWSDTMVADNTFSHGNDFSGRILAAGFRWRAAGENIASGFGTPFSVVKAWMGDVGHCQNILRPMFNFVGTGIVATGNGGGSMADTWTQDFGLLAGTTTGTSNMGPANGCPYKVDESATVASAKPTLIKRSAGHSTAAPSVHVAPTATNGGPTITIG